MTEILESYLIFSELDTLQPDRASSTVFDRFGNHVDIFLSNCHNKIGSVQIIANYNIFLLSAFELTKFRKYVF